MSILLVFLCLIHRAASTNTEMEEHYIRVPKVWPQNANPTTSILWEMHDGGVYKNFYIGV